MLFSVIHFFHLFATVLFATIVQATVASFVVFLVLTDCAGPSNPTYLVDLVTAKISVYRKRFCGRERSTSQS